MPQYAKEVEVERIMNLVRNFGWEKVKEEQIDDDLLITVKKKFPVNIEEASERGAG